MNKLLFSSACRIQSLPSPPPTLAQPHTLAPVPPSAMRLLAKLFCDSHLTDTDTAIGTAIDTAPHRGHTNTSQHARADEEAETGRGRGVQENYTQVAGAGGGQS